VEKEGTIHISNVALWDAKAGGVARRAARPRRRPEGPRVAQDGRDVRRVGRSTINIAVVRPERTEQETGSR